MYVLCLGTDQTRLLAPLQPFSPYLDNSVENAHPRGVEVGMPVAYTVCVRKNAPELCYRFLELRFIFSIFHSLQCISIDPKASFEVRMASSG